MQRDERQRGATEGESAGEYRGGRDRGNANISRLPASKDQGLGLPNDHTHAHTPHTHTHTPFNHTDRYFITAKTEGELSLPIRSHHIKCSFQSQKMWGLLKEIACTSVCGCVCLFTHNDTVPEMWMAIKCKWITRTIWTAKSGENIAMQTSKLQYKPGKIYNTSYQQMTKTCIIASSCQCKSESFTIHYLAWQIAPLILKDKGWPYSILCYCQQIQWEDQQVLPVKPNPAITYAVVVQRTIKNT